MKNLGGLKREILRWAQKDKNLSFDSFYARGPGFPSPVPGLRERSDA